MKRLTTIVVEDERLPRLSLLKKLEDFGDKIEVTDSCDSYESAMQSIIRNKPDLLFMDIQLGGADSMQLLKELKMQMTLPHVIFTTAYDNRQYLLDAIKLSADDYLLKPIEKEKLALAIEKVAKKVAEEGRDDEQKKEKLAFPTVGGKIFLEKAEIAYIKADGNYAEVATFRKTEPVFLSLSAIEAMIRDKAFVRVGRSQIINTDHLYRLNSKRKMCTLRSPEGLEVEVELPKSSFDLLETIY